MKVLRILFKMEQNGMPIDVEYFKEKRYDYGADIASMELALTGKSKISVKCFSGRPGTSATAIPDSSVGLSWVKKLAAI